MNDFDHMFSNFLMSLEYSQDEYDTYRDWAQHAWPIDMTQDLPSPKVADAMLKELAIGDPYYWASHTYSFKDQTKYLLNQGANPIPYFEMLLMCGCGYYPEILKTVLDHYGSGNLQVFKVIIQKNCLELIRNNLEMWEIRFKEAAVALLNNPGGIEDGHLTQEMDDPTVSKFKEAYDMLQTYIQEIVKNRQGEHELGKVLRKIGLPEKSASSWLFDAQSEY